MGKCFIFQYAADQIIGTEEGLSQGQSLLAFKQEHKALE